MAEYIEREAAERILDDVGAPSYAKRALILVPVADVVPVVHGRWDTVFFQRHEGELASYTHVCPGCKFLYRDLRFKGYNYCPNCGARMDGE